MKKRIIILLFLITVCLAGCGTSNDQEESIDVTEVIETAAKRGTEEKSENQTLMEDGKLVMNVSSESITEDGKWITKINATSAKPAGENISPQISFDEVEGAGTYAIYMIDTSAGNWMHWVVKGTSKINIAAGEELENGKYKGPYPPDGIHKYTVYVYALKTEPDEYPGVLDATSSSLEKLEDRLDIVGEQSGNIIGKGKITGEVISGGEIVTK